MKYKGFREPEQNWFKLPNDWTDITARIKSLSELKVVEYVLRHTWGFGDAKKRITIDEFENGRKRRDGSRFDKGTGLSRTSIKSGINEAVKHGLLDREKETGRDPARQSYFYSLHKRDGEDEAGGQDLPPKAINTCPSGGQDLPPKGATTAPRSEKDTLERNLKKETSKALVPPCDTPSGDTEFVFCVQGGVSKEWVLPLSKLEEYQAAYEYIDVSAEMKKAVQWARDNPPRRKTVKGMPAFLTNWLNKAANHGIGRSRINGNGNGKSKNDEVFDSYQEKLDEQIMALEREQTQG